MAERLAHPLPMPVLAIGATGGVGPLLAESLQDAATDLHRCEIVDGQYLPEEAPQAFTKAVAAFWRDTASGGFE